MLLAESLLGSSSTAANYIEDVFSTYLYTGNSTSGGTQTITNNVDLSTKGGMVWIKGRSAASNNVLFDTARGAGASASNNQALSSNLATAEDLGASYDFLSAFNTDGFTVKQGGTTTATRGANYNNVTYASWTFRKQAKFFDIVTWTGNGGTSGRTISHNLGSVPGCIIVKNITSSEDWYVYPASLGNTGTYQYFLILNSTAAQDTGGFGIEKASNWTATQFALSSGSSALNSSGITYVAYLFASNAGGFGATGTDNVISCGSYTGNGSATGPTITLGYEPQWVLIKQATNAGTRWTITDNMRGFPVSSSGQQILQPNTTDADIGVMYIQPTSTGFKVVDTDADVNTNGATYIYIAIRRGPMKTPTTGTSVFSPKAQTATAGTSVDVGFPVDASICTYRTAYNANYMGVTQDRLRGYATTNTSGSYPMLMTWATDSETAFGPGNPVIYGINNAQTTISFGTNAATGSTIVWNFRRAPGFFDVVCYTGNTLVMNINHNLGAVPEMMIFKNRQSAGRSWPVYTAATGNTQALLLNSSAAVNSTGNNYFNSTSPTSTVFTVNTAFSDVGNTNNIVAYLFATVAGVSKVFSYTGNGSSQTINCGFTGGARFVLIKRTDSTGNWTVFDSARGIVAGNDPALYLNSTAAEVTTIDAVDTDSSGFIVNQDATLNLNVNSASYIGLAIA